MFFYGWTLIANLCLCLLFSVWGFALRLSKRWCCLLRNFYPHDPGVQVGSERQAGFWISGSRGECNKSQATNVTASFKHPISYLLLVLAPSRGDTTPAGKMRQQCQICSRPFDIICYHCNALHCECHLRRIFNFSTAAILRKIVADHRRIALILW